MRGRQCPDVAPAKFWWLAFCTVGPLYGQSDLASVSGVVTDEAQTVVPMVAIRVRNVDTHIARTIQTNADGYFIIYQSASRLV
jgi:hypothetical protein